MESKLIYSLNSHGKIGCLPECFLAEFNDAGKIDSIIKKITTTNYKKYEEYFSKEDKILFKICLNLEKEAILLKAAQVAKDVKWNSIFEKTKEQQSATEKTVYEYLVKYIEKEQNNFFNTGKNKLIYLKIENTNQYLHLTVEDDLVDMMYRIEYKDKQILYSPDLYCSEKTISLLNGTLISVTPARIAVNNKIYEFEKDIDGKKLLPFLKKDVVVVPENSVKTYVEKVVIPFIVADKINPIGFKIKTDNTLISAKLSFTQVDIISQPQSLFDLTNNQVTDQQVKLKLTFEYENFTFGAGQTTATIKTDFSDNNISISRVFRDFDMEKKYIKKLKELGMDLSSKIAYLPYHDGYEWLNKNFETLELFGFTIIAENRSTSKKKMFVGNCKIDYNITEERDWFDCKAVTRFGEFTIPIRVILKYIKQEIYEIRLPNGEYAIIPQEWVEDFAPLLPFLIITENDVKIKKQHFILIDNLLKKHNGTATFSENVRTLFSEKTSANYDLPQNFVGELRNYQKEAYNWLRLLNSLNLGGCLADDMGLGKTIQTLALLQWCKENKQGTSLLVVPTSLIFNWQLEIQKFTPNLKVYVHIGNNRVDNHFSFEMYDIILTSYGTLRRDKKLFPPFIFNYAILDESQKIKNPNSDTTKSCFMINAHHYLTLTGTPIENYISDLWSQVNFFNKNMLGSLSSFTENCKSDRYKKLYSQLLNPFIMRRTKAEVLPELPEKQTIIQYCTMTDEQQEIYNTYRNTYRNELLEIKDNKRKIERFAMLVGLMRLRQISNHPVLVDKDFDRNSGKFLMVTELLEEIIEQGDKLLIFSSFVENMKIYRDYLDEKNISYSYIDGTTKNRQKEVEQFQNDSEVKVFLLSLKAGGTGLNLTAASYVFLLDPWWNPAAETQAADRAHRIGQQNKVFIYKFISKDTIEEKILKLQEDKQKLVESMLSQDEDISKQLDIETIMGLLE